MLGDRLQGDRGPAPAALREAVFLPMDDWRALRTLADGAAEASRFSPA